MMPVMRFTFSLWHGQWTQPRNPAAQWLLQCLQELSPAMGCQDVLWAEVGSENPRQRDPELPSWGNCSSYSPCTYHPEFDIFNSLTIWYHEKKIYSNILPWLLIWNKKSLLSGWSWCSRALEAVVCLQWSCQVWATEIGAAALEMSKAAEMRLGDWCRLLSQEDPFWDVEDGYCMLL